MKRFKNILVVCQEDSQPELAVGRALVLAKQNEANVTVVDVVGLRDSEMAELVADTTDPNGASVKNRLSDYHLKHLNACRKPLDDAGISTSTELLWGVEFVEIIRAVIRGEHDLVIKAINPKRQFRGQTILGGLDMHLMRKCPCPVWILKDQFDRDDMKVLAAVDPQTPCEENEDLNRLIMDLATSVSSTANGQLHVLHAWMVEEERALLFEDREHSGTEEADKIRSKIREMREDRLCSLLSHYEGERAPRQVNLLRGNPGDIVPEFVANNAIDLVVMGTVSRVDLPGMFMGDTAEMILNRVSCSVLAVKPKGFRTPIELANGDSHASRPAPALKIA